MPKQRSTKFLKILQILLTNLGLITLGKWFIKLRRTYLNINFRAVARYFSIGRTTKFDVSKKLKSDGRIYIHESVRFIRILNIVNQGGLLLGSGTFIAFKLDEFDSDNRIKPYNRTGGCYHFSILKPGQERLGDQVFFFTFSRWLNVENNYKMLVDFIQDEYIDPEERRIENAYFRDIMLSNRDENNR
jgi:hypothetical protein